jgi:hypothetical protein
LPFKSIAFPSFSGLDLFPYDRSSKPAPVMLEPQCLLMLRRKSYYYANL